MSVWNHWIVLPLLAVVVGPCSENPASAQDANTKAVKVKPLPPPGLPIKPDVLAILETRCKALRATIDAEDRLSDPVATDALVLVRAVEMAIATNGFYNKKDVAWSNTLLDLAEQRFRATRPDPLLRIGLEPGKAAPQTLVGGFRSRLDASEQPFGLVLPAGFKGNEKGLRLDVWLHGRGDSKTELAFLRERSSKVGTYPPADSQTVVLHPFGRHCNAFKFAGEVDVLESVTHIQSMLDIDPGRIVIRGFSMGGAGVWHLSAHYPSRWMASNPGAGFVDTIVYQRWQDRMPYTLGPIRERLLRGYDVLPWVDNFRKLPVIAYSGEVDKQRQAAARVVAAANERGIPMTHVIGKGMGHKIDAASKEIVQRELASISDSVSSDWEAIDFTTFTTRYSRCNWLSVDGLESQFSKGRIVATPVDGTALEIQCEGITRFSVDLPARFFKQTPDALEFRRGDDRLLLADADPRAGYQASIEIKDGEMKPAPAVETIAMIKRPGLQGPIDDAFCDSFLFVLPSRPATHGNVQRWIEREQTYAMRRWQTIMRGNIRTVRDVDVTAAMAQTHHLVCFGDLTSNRYLRKLAGSLPISWDKDSIRVGPKRFPAATSAVAMIFPNPLSSHPLSTEPLSSQGTAARRYVVINSGMTFRDFSNTSNSRQISMLGDYAVFDVMETDNHIFAGEILDEGFFDETWGLAPSTRDPR
ncbi:MAG: prolyl oligopeptidase family serine peptidase [Planctomycetota bacterium]